MLNDIHFNWHYKYAIAVDSNRHFIVITAVKTFDYFVFKVKISIIFSK